jgi:hypothetical protein
MHSSCGDPCGPRGQVGAYRGVPSLPSLTLFTSINIPGGALKRAPSEVHVNIDHWSMFNIRLLKEKSFAIDGGILST